MGFWQNIFGTPSTTLGIQSPYAPTDTLVSFVASDVLGDLSDLGIIDRNIALRVPGIKRAHGIHCAMVAGLQFYQMDAEQRTIEQPEWLTNSASGVAPYHRWYGVVSDLFMRGWACLGFTEDMSDCIHIPDGLWGVDHGGNLTTSDTVNPKYRAKPIAIPLGYGSNGILVDGIDSIRSARAIEKAWNDRVDNPIPATNLHITDPAYDNLSKKEKLRIVDQWNENRKRDGGSTAITQSFIDVISLGSVSADLFEKGRNAVRLDLANHSGVPASIIEGAKDGGGSDINYSNDSSTHHELYDFGTKAFVQAIEARLSLDDICAPGLSIRADLTGIIALPEPTTNPTSTD